MPEAEEKRLPRRPLRLVLSLVLTFEVFMLVLLFGEGDLESIPTILNSVGLLVFSVLTWRGIPWSRWLLVAVAVWRVVAVGISLSSYFGDHRTAGSLLLIGFYVAVGLLVASPLGRLRVRAAA